MIYVNNQPINKIPQAMHTTHSLGLNLQPEEAPVYPPANNYASIRDALLRLGIKATYRAIQSDNFVEDVSGWKLSADGVGYLAEGNIGGWNINATTIYSDGNNIILDSANKKMESGNYVSGRAGAGFHISEDLFETANFAARGLIRTAVFQKDVTSVICGNEIVAPNGDVLNVDMTALDASTLTTKGTATFSVNDLLQIKDGTDNEWFKVTAVNGNVYTVERDKNSDYAADTNPAWKKGATVVNYGQSGDGGIFMTASESNAPYLSVFTHAGSPWSALTTRLRIGNLNGYLGYSSDLYGIGIGDANSYLTYDPTNGMTLSGTYNTLNGNLFLGSGTGQANTSGHDNAFLGYQCGYSNTDGYRNLFAGYQAGYSNTSGRNNTMIGYLTGYNATTAIDNVFIGYYAGYETTLGNSNIFIGDECGIKNTIGTENVYMGYRAGRYNTEGSYNIVLGHRAGEGSLGLSDYDNNVIIGLKAGYKLRTGHSNVLVGMYAGQDMTTGNSDTCLGKQAGFNLVGGSSNTFIGCSAGNNCVSHSDNVCVGYNAGSSVITGNCTLIGKDAGENITTGGSNTCLGNSAGDAIITGFGNVMIGIGANVTTESVDCSIGIGVGAKTTASYQLVIGGQTNYGGGITSRITDIYFGSGITDSSPHSHTINATGGSGTDIAGADMSIAGGKGTGNAVGGSIIFKTSTVGASGETLQTLATRLTIDNKANVVLGTAAIATNATDGFLYIPSCAGAPTGTPTTKTGRVAIVFDTTNNKLYCYDGGWVDVT